MQSRGIAVLEITMPRLYSLSRMSLTEYIFLRMPCHFLLYWQQSPGLSSGNMTITRINLSPILVIFCFSSLRGFGAHVNKCFIIKDNIYRHVFFSGNSKPLFPIGYQNITSWHYKHVGTFLLASIRLSFRLSLINAHSCINRSEIHVFRCISGITRIHM